MKFFLLSTVLLFKSSFADLTHTRIVFFGDSLTAGYGVTEAEAYPTLVNQRFKDLGKKVECINAGVSGDTTTSGLKRLDWVLKQKPNWVIIALGANDMMRGVDPKAAEKNLKEIITKVRQAHAEPILFGMKAFPNLGPKFKAEYETLFPRLARAEKVKYLDFFLEGVAGDPKLNQPDGIHPNAAGQALIANRVFKFLSKEIK